MPFYRKKPVLIEARQLTATNAGSIAQWCGSTLNMPEYLQTVDCLIIPTLEGDMKASVGDYIIKGVHGEFYPCKPDIFLKTYDFVSHLENEPSEQER